MPLNFPRRTVHLDFHTSPEIRDVGADFRKDEFAETFAKAHVDSVTVFAKCHHGHLYYATDRPERHPGLAKGLNLLGEQIEALHSRGIRAPIYISVQVDEYAANTHPEWVAIDEEGRRVKRGGHFEPGWQILDMSSPYQEYLVEQIEDVMRTFAPVDGIFFDMCWDQESCSKWAIDAMRRQGLDPRSKEDRRRYARQVAWAYMGRFKEIVDRAQAAAGGEPIGIWFNSRPKTNLYEEKRFLRHVEIECLPTGSWGYSFFPYIARFVRPLGLPTLSHTGRFHTSWGDFGGLKPQAALEYECALIFSQGFTNGVGDHLHPRGVPDKAAYELIGRVYERIKRMEPWVEGGEVQSQIAVLIDAEKGGRPRTDALGFVRALTELRHQFDLLPQDGDFASYDLVIVPESVRVDGRLKESLRAYLAAGGAVIVSHRAALDETGAPILDELGIEVHGESPFRVTYLRPAEAIAKDLPSMDHVILEQGFRMTPAGGAVGLCGVVEPYFERNYLHFCSHRQTPPATPTPYSAIVQNGRAITFAFPIFTAYGSRAAIPYRTILGNCIDRLLPRPLLRAGGPARLETTVVRRGSTTVVNLISYCPERRTDSLDIVEDPIPLVEVPVSVRMDAPPARVYLAPSREELAWEYRDGYVETTVTSLEGHTLLVCEG